MCRRCWKRWAWSSSSTTRRTIACARSRSLAKWLRGGPLSRTLVVGDIVANRIPEAGGGQRQTCRRDHHQTEREDEPLIDDRANPGLCHLRARHLRQFAI